MGLNTSAAGTYSGNVIITSNDSIENPFSFPITGTVKLPLQVIDDSAGAAGGFTTTGTWQAWTGLSLAYGGTDHEAMSANATATWTFSSLPAGATYDVYVTWPANSNRANDVPYTVTADGATTPFTVNQKGVPSVPISGSGPTGGSWSWYELPSGVVGGSYTAGANGQLVVQVSNKGLPARSSTANNVEADAVMIVQEEPELAAGGVGHNPNATSVTASEAMPLVQEADAPLGGGRRERLGAGQRAGGRGEPAGHGVGRVVCAGAYDLLGHQRPGLWLVHRSDSRPGQRVPGAGGEDRGACDQRPGGGGDGFADGDHARDGALPGLSGSESAGFPRTI